MTSSFNVITSLVDQVPEILKLKIGSKTYLKNSEKRFVRSRKGFWQISSDIRGLMQDFHFTPVKIGKL